MSYKKVGLYPPNPNTSRGVSTKLSASKDKIVYANGKSIIIRDLHSPALTTAYSGHTANTTVARISPSGYYCASADISGTVRVWDIVGEDQVLKGKHSVLLGRINDLEWDGESKRIIAVGDGKEKFGHAFMMDSGSSTGEIVGHSKTINGVSIRHLRPFRAATAADDATIVFHQGVPYKYDKSIKTHTKFVQDVRYAHSGEHFASVGSDAKIFIYDGKTGDMLREFTNDTHAGSIMSCVWSPDDNHLVTSSADCTVKLWDVQAGQAVTTWDLGAGVGNQQLGNTWSGIGDIVSLSMSGDLNVFDARIGDKSARVIKGPQQSITALAPSPSNTFLAGTASGRILSYSTSTGEANSLDGDGHSNKITALAPTLDGRTFSSGYDDKVREIEVTGFTPTATSTSTQPKAITVTEDSSVMIAEADCIEVIKSGQKILELPAPFQPSSITASKMLVAVGGNDSQIHLYDWDGQALNEIAVLKGNKAAVTAIKFSPDTTLLAAGDNSGAIILFDVKERKVITSRWTFHNARVNSLDWNADGVHCASGSLDTHVYIWSVQKPLRNIAIKNAGPGGVDAVLWTEPPSRKLVSAGADGCLRTWEITFHA